jgi:WD40 repeat protein
MFLVFAVIDEELGEQLRATGGRNRRNDVVAWDVETGKSITGIKDVARTAENITYSLDDLSFSPDGRKLLCSDRWSGSRGDKIDFIDRAKQVTIWDWQEKKLLATWQLTRRELPWGGHLTWLNNDHVLVTASTENSRISFVLDAATGAAVREMPGIVAPYRENFWSLDGDRMHLIEPESGTDIESFAVEPLQYAGRPQVSPDGAWFAAFISANTIFLADLRSRRQVAPSADMLQQQPNVAYVPDGRLMVNEGTRQIIIDDDSGQRLQLINADCFQAGERELFSPDGRMLVANTDERGRTQLWDTISATMLGTLDASRTRMRGGFHSEDGKYTAAVGVENGPLIVFDRATRRELASFSAAHGPFSRRVAPDVSVCRWNRAGDRMYMADTGARNSDEFCTGIYATLGGELLHRFVLPDGTFVVTASELRIDEAHDLVYLSYWRSSAKADWERNPPYKQGLWRMSDGSFVRDVERGGIDVRFSDDGALLVSKDCAVAVASGKVLHTFPEGSFNSLSPSRTTVASVDDAGLTLTDVRTGHVFWQVPLPLANSKEGFVETGRHGRSFAWHPSECQIAFTRNNECLAYQVDLYKMDMVSGSGALASLDATERARAAVDLVRGGSSSLASLRSQLLGAEKPDSAAIRSAILALEWLARDGDDSAVKMLREAKASHDSTVSGCAADGLRRLEAAARARELRRVNELAEDVHIPDVSPAGTGGW